jgi:hypothetical protein
MGDKERRANRGTIVTTSWEQVNIPEARLLLDEHISLRVEEGAPTQAKIRSGIVLRILIEALRMQQECLLKDVLN